MKGIPAYTVRVSARAKQARVEVSARHGLVVIIPKGFARRRIPAMLDSMRDWIEKTAERVCQPKPCQPDPRELPQQISLSAIQEEWVVQTRQTEGSAIKALEPGPGTLLLSGNVSHIPACHKLLSVWLNRKSHRHLVPWLQQISGEQGLPFDRAMVRSQRTRWGSCSARKTISINQNLLFLPPHLVRYVFIHELCHTVHLNHSRDFWDLVHQREPDYVDFRRELRQAHRLVPDWVMV